jgi:hypothetical protein
VLAYPATIDRHLAKLLSRDPATTAGSPGALAAVGEPGYREEFT